VYKNEGRQMARPWPPNAGHSTGAIGPALWEPPGLEEIELLSALLAEQGIPTTCLTQAGT